MNSPLPSPPVWRIFAAFLITPMVAALSLACLLPGAVNWPSVLEYASLFALFYAYPATLMLGVPAFFIFRRGKGSWLLKSLVIGAAIAALPLPVLGALANPQHAFSNGHVTHQNGMRTLDGWIDLGKVVGFVAILGALAGFVFWIVAAAGVRRLRNNSVPTDASSKAPTP